MENEGFDSIAERATMNSIEGMDANNLPRFVETLPRRLNIPEQHVSDSFDLLLESIPHVRADSWNEFEVLFTKDKGGGCRYVSILYRRHDDTKETDWLIANIEATFTLAPRLQVVKRCDSESFLNIFSTNSCDEMIHEIHRAITDTDVEAVFDFMRVVALKRFADMVGVTARFPEIGGSSYYAITAVDVAGSMSSQDAWAIHSSHIGLVAIAVVAIALAALASKALNPNEDKVASLTKVLVEEPQKEDYGSIAMPTPSPA